MRWSRIVNVSFSRLFCLGLFDYNSQLWCCVPWFYLRKHHEVLNLLISLGIHAHINSLHVNQARKTGRRLTKCLESGLPTFLASSRFGGVTAFLLFVPIVFGWGVALCEGFVPGFPFFFRSESVLIGTDGDFSLSTFICNRQNMLRVSGEDYERKSNVNYTPLVFSYPTGEVKPFLAKFFWLLTRV